MSALFALLAAALAAQPPGPTALTVSPAAVPTPALKYRLIPDERELTPGNAATLYQRSLAMFVENQWLLEEIRKDHWSNWLSAPLESWPKDEVAGKLPLTRHFQRELEYAAHCRDCDWQLNGRREGIGLLLPDVQGFRTLGMVLAVQARHSIATGDFEGAARALRSGFALGRDLGRRPCCLIQVLVGAAITNMMLNQVEAWVQSPGAPNLYWSLSALPRPYFDIYPAVAEDLVMVERSMPWLTRVEGGPMSPAQVKAARDALERQQNDFSMRPPNDLERATREAALEAVALEGRDVLLKQGYTAAQLDAMPAFQQAGLFALREYRTAGEELLKWFHVPGHLNSPGFQTAAKQYNAAVGRLDMLFFRGLLTGLMDREPANAFRKTAEAAARTDRRVATLRTVEAVRLYAAGHGGKLPAKLADVTDVPVPPDPMTGQPLDYAVNDGKARLTCPCSPNPLAYSVELRR